MEAKVFSTADSRFLRNFIRTGLRRPGLHDSAGYPADPWTLREQAKKAKRQAKRKKAAKVAKASKKRNRR